MPLPASKLILCKSTKRKLALNYDTDDKTEEVENDYNGNDSNKKAAWITKRMIIQMVV